MRYGTLYGLLIVLCCIIFWHLHWAWADEVHLKNGDRLTGTIIELVRGRLRVNTDYAGELVIRWDRVAALKTDQPVALILDNGERWIGWLGSDDGKDSFALSSDGKHPLELATIVTVVPLADKERQGAGDLSKPALWKHRLEMGAQVRSGNTDSTDIILGYQAQRQSTRSELTTDVTAAYGETDGERTAQRAGAAGRLNLLHTERFFSFYLLTLEHDALEDLDLRAQEQAGIGYKLVRTPRTFVQGEVGFGVREELFENGDLQIEPVGRIGGKWTQKIGAATELVVGAAFLPDLIDRGQYRMEGEASLSTPITNRFSLRLSLVDSFDSNPQPGVKKNDLTLLSSLVWTLQ